MGHLHTSISELYNLALIEALRKNNQEEVANLLSIGADPNLLKVRKQSDWQNQLFNPESWINENV